MKKEISTGAADLENLGKDDTESKKGERLLDEQKVFIVQCLACMDSVATTRRKFKLEYGKNLKPSHVQHYNPERSAFVAYRLKELFWKTREEFLSAKSKAPIAQQQYRLRVADLLVEMALKDEEIDKEVVLRVMEYAAKELGGAFTNNRIVSGAIKFEHEKIRELDDEALQRIVQGESLDSIME